MGGGDHCVVQNCNNDRRYPNKYVIKDHINSFNGSLQLKFWRCKDAKMLPKWNSKIGLFRSHFRVSLNSPVGSNHFKMGRPTNIYPYPTEYLNGYDNELKNRKSPLKRSSELNKKKFVAKLSDNHYQNEYNHDQNIINHDKNNDYHHQNENTQPMDIHYDHDYALPVVPVSVSLEKDLKILQNTPKRILKKPLLLKHRKRLLSKFSLIPQAEFTWNRLSHSDRLIKFYTGCTKKVFMFLVSKGKKKYENVCYYKGKPSQSFKFRSENKKKPGNKRTLTIEDEILLMCMKLRLDLAIQDLAFRFSISNSQCSSILTTWITYFGNELKPLLLWPTGKLHNVEGIIDCTEQKIQKPSNAKAQYQTFSTYKSCNTLKKLVVTTKTGSFSFISKAYGGQASDRHITEDCNVINMFSEGSVCLADKGFNIQELLLKKKVVLVCPPFKKKGLHFTRTKVLSAKEIARSRVHVERSIRRLKEFKICKNELSLTMLNLIDYIYIICGALSNLQPSILGSE
nr:uncharacterized protein LOC105845924 [Hydra vulgaris]